jgi:4-hydroxy-3-methylbut-2-enyl diphosphate reductase
VKNVGVTAGASAPEHLVQELIEFLQVHGFRQMEEIEMVDEDVRFSLPAELTVSIR